MKLTFTIDQTDGQILAVYFGLNENKVYKTIEVADGECYLDVDRQGKPVGVEMLCPGKVEILTRKVARKYHIQGMSRAVKRVKAALQIAT